MNRKSPCVEIESMSAANDRFALARHYTQARRPQTKLVILPNQQMTLAAAEQARVSNEADIVIVFDTNPIDLKSADDLKTLNVRYPKLLLRDHHGPSYKPQPIGQEDTTVKIMLSELQNTDSVLARALCDSRKILAVTNQGNYDPDGVLSWAIIREPEMALRHAPELTGAAWVTDHALFGGRSYTTDPDGRTLSDAERLGYTLLHWQIVQNDVLVDEVLTDRSIEPTRDNVRSVFSGDAAVYGPETLGSIFDELVDDLPQLLMNMRYYLGRGRARPWRRYYNRIRTAEANVRKGTVTDSLVATYRYSERPDFSYKIHCWLACGAPAPFAPNVPLQIAYSERTKQCVASVPYSTQRDHALNWDLVPVMRLANAEEEAAGSEGRWGGRGSVVFRFTPNKPYHVTPERLAQLMHEAYNAGTISSPKTA